MVYDSTVMNLTAFGKRLLSKIKLILGSETPYIVVTLAAALYIVLTS